MLEWEETKSLRPECLPIYHSQEIPTSTFEPKTKILELDQLDEVTFETTADTDFESTETTDSTQNTEGIASTDTSSTTSTTTTSSTDNTYGEDVETSYSSTETHGEELSNTEVIFEEPFVASECEYNELFWNAYNCGVENSCYADQFKLAQSPESLSSQTVNGSKSHFNWPLAGIVVVSVIAVINLYRISRRLYTSMFYKCILYKHLICNNCGNLYTEFQDKCSCVALSNSLRYLRNKWEQIRGYRYQKTHDDLNGIDESDDAEMYGKESDKDESITNDTNATGVTYNGPLNDSDSSDDEELQKTSSSKAMSLDEQTDGIIDELNVNKKLLVNKGNGSNKNSLNEEEKDREEQEIAMQEL